MEPEIATDNSKIALAILRFLARSRGGHRGAIGEGHCEAARVGRWDDADGVGVAEQTRQGKAGRETQRGATTRGRRSSKRPLAQTSFS